jgi:DNA-binding NtrC family response regulator
MKKHILSVDDEQGIRDILRESLTMQGYEVSTAATAEEAKKLAKANKPDLIILDFQISHSDGSILIDEFRAMYPGLPLMLLTGAVFATDAVRKTILTRVASYLDKTESLSKIFEEVERLIGKP